MNKDKHVKKNWFDTARELFSRARNFMIRNKDLVARTGVFLLPTTFSRACLSPEAAFPFAIASFAMASLWPIAKDSILSPMKALKLGAFTLATTMAISWGYHELSVEKYPRRSLIEELTAKAVLKPNFKMGIKFPLEHAGRKYAVTLRELVIDLDESGPNFNYFSGKEFKYFFRRMPAFKGVFEYQRRDFFTGKNKKNEVKILSDFAYYIYLRENSLNDPFKNIWKGKSPQDKLKLTP